MSRYTFDFVYPEIWVLGTHFAVQEPYVIVPQPRKATVTHSYLFLYPKKFRPASQIRFHFHSVDPQALLANVRLIQLDAVQWNNSLSESIFSRTSVSLQISMHLFLLIGMHCFLLQLLRIPWSSFHHCLPDCPQSTVTEVTA